MAKTKEEKQLLAYVHLTRKRLNDIYSNKSSDEYKSAGDITKTSAYVTISELVKDLDDLKGLPKSHVDTIRTAFDCLHKPIWKEQVQKYMNEPDETNLIYTGLYTAGFRTLVAELSRIYTCSTVDEKGVFTYNSDKVKSDTEIMQMLKLYNNDFDKWIEKQLKRAHGESIEEYAVLEYATYYESFDADGYPIQEGVAEVAERLLTKGITKIVNFFKLTMTGFKELNPISFISSLLTRSYDRKVKKFEEASEMYLETKKAYEEYKKLPASKRSGAIEKQYQKNIEKYNLKMKDLYAEVKHYDQRAEAETEKEFERFREKLKDEEVKESSEKETKSDTTTTDTSEETKPESSMDDDLGF